MNLGVKSLLGGFAIVCGFLLVLVLWPACGCLPTDYQEIDPAGLPPEVRATASKLEPGLTPRRAWEFRLGGRPKDRPVDGYLIRGKVPGSRWEKDVKFSVPPPPPDPEAVELSPVD